jgi:hypothetical protein
MPIPAPGTTLDDIMVKVRRLTRSPSTAQLSDEQIQDYINTFILYDFPEHLRMFNLKTPVSFQCNAFQDVYPTDIVSFGLATNASGNPLYNFQNIYLTISPPFFIAGFPAAYMQDRSSFFGIYPKVNNIQTIGVVGDGTTVSFSGVIPTEGVTNSLTLGLQQQSCFVKGEVLFSSVDINGNSLSLIDAPCLDGTTGNPTVWGNLFVPGTIPPTNDPTYPLITNYTTTPLPTGVNPDNYINYITGAFTITFPFAPQQGYAINSQTLIQIVSLPQSVLYFDNQFVLRPVPDQPYTINFEAFVRPTYLMETDQSPQLEEWWQYVAYGAAKKVFEDRMDLDSVALILPEYKKQETLCLRRTIVQNTTQRTATIYTDQTGFGQGPGWFGWGSTGWT